MYIKLKYKSIFESCHLCPFSFSSKVCNLLSCHCRFREDPLVPRGVWRICQLKDSKAGDVGPMVMYLMWPNFRQFNSSKEAHWGKTCYSTATYMLHMSETFQDKSFYENAHEISAQCCRLSVLVLKVNTQDFEENLLKRIRLFTHFCRESCQSQSSRTGWFSCS